MLLGELDERRQRAAIHLAVSVGLLSAVIALPLTTGLGAALRSQQSLQAVALLAVGLVAGTVAAAFVGLDPGLPWEGSPRAERIGLVLGTLVSAPMHREARDAMRKGYDSGLTYRRFVRFSQTTDWMMMRQSINDLTLVDVDLRIGACALLLERYRLWRRLVVPALIGSTLVILIGAAWTVALAVGAPPWLVAATAATCAVLVLVGMLIKATS